MDLGQVKWSRGNYATEELSNLYTGDDVRVAKVLESVQRIVADPGRMRALGFCVSKDHAARFMARRFTGGWPREQEALPGTTLSMIELKP